MSTQATAAATAAADLETVPINRLEHFPASFFAMVMGLAGLTIGWEKAQAAVGMNFPFVPWLIATATLVFTVLAVLYLAKLVLHPSAVRAELRHPVRINFMPAMAISLLLLAIVYLHPAPDVSRWLWITGATLQLGFTLFVVNSWMHHEHFQVLHMNPAWFIPAVGNVLVPVAGVPLGYEQVSWFFFSIGILLWPVLLTIVFNRVLFHQPLPERLMPTLFILVAPPRWALLPMSGSRAAWTCSHRFSTSRRCSLRCCSPRSCRASCGSSFTYPGGRTPSRWQPSPSPAC